MARVGNHELWLWVQFAGAHFERLRAECAAFPSVDGLRVTAFDDPRSTAGLVRLRFSGGHAQRREVRVWAELAGLQMIDTTSWSAEKKLGFECAIEPFKCSGRDGLTGVFGLSLELLRAASLSVSDGVPHFVGPACAETRRGHFIGGISA